MSFLVKRLFKINVSLKTSVLVFCPMRLGPVRVTIYNDRAVAQVAQEKFLFRTRNQTNSRILKHASPPPQKKTLQAPHSHITDKNCCDEEPVLTYVSLNCECTYLLGHWPLLSGDVIVIKTRLTSETSNNIKKTLTLPSHFRTSWP